MSVCRHIWQYGKCLKCGASKAEPESGNPPTHVCGLEGYGAGGDNCPACEWSRVKASGNQPKKGMMPTEPGANPTISVPSATVASPEVAGLAAYSWGAKLIENSMTWVPQWEAENKLSDLRQQLQAAERDANREHSANAVLAQKIVAAERERDRLANLVRDANADYVAAESRERKMREALQTISNKFVGHPAATMAYAAQKEEGKDGPNG